MEMLSAAGRPLGNDAEGLTVRGQVINTRTHAGEWACPEFRRTLITALPAPKGP